MARIDQSHETDAALIRADIHKYLDKYENKELLRFVAVGSVDDGKSTLIGRLLHDTGMVYEDQLAAAKKATKMEGEEIDFSLLTDGLRAEREQGITIDVAYRYFSTDVRKFIIADTPGHVQYTRNMVTGASTANVGIILIDARLRVLPQSRRHAYIASLLGIPHLAVCINKMDLVNYDQAVFESIKEEFTQFASGLRFTDVTFFPISALKGVNLVSNSELTPWYDGPDVLEYLENVPIASDINLKSFRFPVQATLRPNLNYRGFTGQIASGTVKVGDAILSLPSGKTSTVVGIDQFGTPIPEATAPQSVSIRLADEIDTSRGDMFVLPSDLPLVSRTLEAHLVWMSETPLDRQKSYLLKHTTQIVRAQVTTIHWRKDMDTLAEVPAATLGLNDIGRVTLACTQALFVDPYATNRATGSFILIDSLTNNTVGAGMVADHVGERDLDAALREARAGTGLPATTHVSPRERFDRLGQTGATIWLTGLPGSGKWALGYAIERTLFDTGRSASVIDPKGLDLDAAIAACKAVTDAGMIAICAFPSHKRSDRKQLIKTIGVDRLFRVFVDTDPALCRERRPDADFSVFEPPENAEVTVHLHRQRLIEAAKQVLAALDAKGQFNRPSA